MGAGPRADARSSKQTTVPFANLPIGFSPWLEGVNEDEDEQYDAFSATFCLPPILFAPWNGGKYGAPRCVVRNDHSHLPLASHVVFALARGRGRGQTQETRNIPRRLPQPSHLVCATQ